MQILTLHREPSRHAYFAGPAGHPAFFEPSLKCWVVSDPADVEAILQSRSFDVVTLHTAYESFQNISSQPFPNIIFALRHIPLGLNDEAHRDIRRRMAELIARRRGAVSVAVPGLVDKWFGPIETREEVDLVGEVLAPMVTEFIALVTGVDAAGIPDCRRASMIFDRMIGLRTRHELEQEVGALRTAIRSSLAPGAADVEEGLRLALFALGNDALIGTIGESLHRIFEANPGVALNAIQFPDWPVETGVPFVERVATEAFEIGGAVLSCGERVRVMMQSFAYSPDPADRERIFGAGVHSCLGRQMSVELWRAIVARLSRMHVSVEVIDHALREDNFVFTCPARLTLRIAR
jgi:cytochrome P450